MKAKSTLIIISTLLVGIIIGFLINGQITHKKYKKFVEYRKEEGFKNRFHKRFDLTAEQRDILDPIIEKYAKLNSARMKDFRKVFDSTMTDFHREIEPYLTPEQIKKLEEDKARFGKRPPHGKRGHHPDSPK